MLSGAWTPAPAALALGLSARQVRRLLVASQARGPGGLVHGNRGRRPVKRLPEPVREITATRAIRLVVKGGTVIHQEPTLVMA